MTGASLTVLILGGYGTFGGRLAELLAGEPRLRLLIAGRSPAKAESFCRGHRSKAAMQPLAFDRDGDLAAQLGAAAPDILVDASGPFQAYGERPYRLVEAAIAAGIHYLDLADGSDFVAGIGRFGEAARARGVFVLGGVSSCPVLTAAAVRVLSRDMAKVDAITGGIAPSPFAKVGPNVIRAIIGYGGKRVTRRRDGRTGFGYGLVDIRDVVVAPPGAVPLKRRRFSLIDVPELTILPQLWPEVRDVWMGAGPVPALLHTDLRVMAWMVRLRLLPSLLPFARLIEAGNRIFRWGEHRGGMFVEVVGRDRDGEPITRSWHMVAEGDDGPYIPSMPAEAIIRKCLAGTAPAAGARPALSELEFTDYDALFAGRAIRTGIRTRSRASAKLPLSRRLLGDAWPNLPEPIRAMHALDGRMQASGRADIERGTGLAARIVARIFGFPPAGRDVPVTVTFTEERGGETWQRDFGGAVFRSHQAEGHGGFEGMVVERFGPFAFGLAMVVDEGRLFLVPRRWTFLGIPLPRFLAPRGKSYEHAEDGRFNFHVEIGLPLIGMVVRYRGWLER